GGTGILLVAVGVGGLLFWRGIQPGTLVDPETLAGPDTLVLLSLDLRREDPGVSAALARLVQREGMRKKRRLPAWALWMLGGGTESLPLRAAAVLPVRLVVAVDRPPGGELTGGCVVSLSRYFPRLPSALGASPDPQVEGLPVLRPSARGGYWTGLLANNILLSSEADGLRILAARVGGRTSQPGPLFDAVREATPPPADGIGILLNPGDR